MNCRSIKIINQFFFQVSKPFLWKQRKDSKWALNFDNFLNVLPYISSAALFLDLFVYGVRNEELLLQINNNGSGIAINFEISFLSCNCHTIMYPTTMHRNRKGRHSRRAEQLAALLCLVEASANQ